MFNLRDVLFAFVWVGMLVLIGRFLKAKIKVFQRLYLPESIIAGAIGLILGPQVLGAIAGEDTFLSGGVFTEPIRTVWSQSPGVFINIVFAALFLGETIPRPQDIWRKAAPQVVFGQALAWGQYVVGILITLAVLIPVFGANPIAASLIEIAFEGGHGTAGGMAETFSALDYADGADLALGLATVGIVSGIIAGTALADWGRRNGHIQTFTPEVEDPNNLPPEVAHPEAPETRQRRSALMRNLLVDPLSLNFGFVGIAVAIGWLIQQGLVLIENLTWGQTGFEIMRFVPLFPMALIGGVVVQVAMTRLGLESLIIEPLMKRIAGMALDVVVVTALASISIQVIGDNLATFIILSVVGITWNVLMFMYYAPRIFPDYWFEKGIGDLGQSMGVTATGILLLRMVDPKNDSGAFESFAYKQLFFEPIVGGGLFTAAAPALIVRLGMLPMLMITGGLLVFWLVAGALLMRSNKQQVVS